MMKVYMNISWIKILLRLDSFNEINIQVTPTTYNYCYIIIIIMNKSLIYVFTNCSLR